MTVYEMMQELAKYKANDEVIFHVTAEYSADVEAEFDREKENDTQEVTVETKFDEDVDFINIGLRHWDKGKAVVYLKY